MFVRPRSAIVLGLCLMASAALAQATPGAAGPWDQIDEVLGRKGTPNPGGVQKYGFPRSDLTVTVRGVAVKPALALGSWVAFKDMGSGRAMMMGDLVLADTEVTTAIQALQTGGVEVTALHNHLLFESPRVMYLHVRALDDPVRIARTLRDALGRTGTPLGTPAASTTASIDLDTAAVAQSLRVAGKVNGGVYQVSVPRPERISEEGHDVPAAMGVATAINFQPTGGGKAAITGDFVLLAAEVNPVIRALRENGIEITALHSHMLDEQPRLYFMHFWANDDAVKLARGLRAALDRMARS